MLNTLIKRLSMFQSGFCIFKRRIILASKNKLLDKDLVLYFLVKIIANAQHFADFIALFDQ